MTASYAATFLAVDAERTEKALEILRQPEHYKVCDGCYAIHKTGAKLCGVCGSYRWRARVNAVRAVIKIILKRKDPFPLTQACLPRIIQGA